MPPGADETRFFGAILEELGVPGTRSERVAVRQDAAVKVLRATQVRLLIIDEAHNVLSGTRDQQRRLLNLWRWLGNEVQIPLMAVGTAEALRAVQSDDQLANRFEPLRLPLWRDDEEYRRLLTTLEAVLPLRKPSNLASAELAKTILAMSEGILGEIVAVVSRAAVQAVRSGAESISVKTIAQTGFMAPTERRRVVG
jgi:type II secretory pathway predicted ATPase ExeA